MSTDSENQVTRGPMSGYQIIGEVTEAIQKFIVDGWEFEEGTPELKEELDYVPMDRNEKVIYVYMYRVASNPNLQNQKRWRQAPVFMNADEEDGQVYFHRPPMMLDLFYLILVHSKFRSEAERLLGWLLLRLHEATHLIYRPRKFILPDGREVDSIGDPYDSEADMSQENLMVEKVSLALIDDLTVGDAVNIFSLHEAPYRPFLTYRARVAVDGPLVHMSGTTISRGRANSNEAPRDRSFRKNGRMIPEKPSSNNRPKRPFFRRDTDTDPSNKE